MICGERQNHQPMGHPRSLAAQCQKPKGHEHGPDNATRTHKDRVEGYTIMWMTTEPIRNS